jgi:hypothetical protein
VRLKGYHHAEVIAKLHQASEMALRGQPQRRDFQGDRHQCHDPWRKEYGDSPDPPDNRSGVPADRTMTQAQIEALQVKTDSFEDYHSSAAGEECTRRVVSPAQNQSLTQVLDAAGWVKICGGT